MPLSEPLTTLTDYVLAAVSLGAAIALARSIGPRNRVSAWFWCAAFIAAGVAATTGGSYHGFKPRLDPSTIRGLWNLTMFSMGACGAFATAGIHAAEVRRADGTVTWLAAGIAVTLLGAGVQQGMLSTFARWNPNVAFHLIQIAGLYCFYRCARTVHDRPAAPRT
jgi:uncharacterized protein DUF6962